MVVQVLTVPLLGERRKGQCTRVSLKRYVVRFACLRTVDIILTELIRDSMLLSISYR